MSRFEIGRVYEPVKKHLGAITVVDRTDNELLYTSEILEGHTATAVIRKHDNGDEYITPFHIGSFFYNDFAWESADERWGW